MPMRNVSREEYKQALLEEEKNAVAWYKQLIRKYRQGKISQAAYNKKSKHFDGWLLTINAKKGKLGMPLLTIDLTGAYHD
jgi:hypothetical protein